jgi:hypothetical protein
MSDAEKAREHRLRRAAQREGLLLAKSQGRASRDSRAYEFGSYMLVDTATNTLVPGDQETSYDNNGEGFINGALS